MKFTKEIVAPGKYRAMKPGTSERVDNPVTPNRIKRWVDTFQRMKADGIKIPAPFRHDLKIAGLSKEQAEALEKEQKERGSLLNAGYWDDFFVDSKSGKLCGVLDVPDKSLADKVGTSIQEVSLFSVPEWEDGVGKKWTDPILHVALVTNPIVPGQDNFQPLPENVPGVAVAMSHFVDVLSPEEIANDEIPASVNSLDLATPVNLSDALAVLAKFGIELPADTSLNNLPERIQMVGKAVLVAKGEEQNDDPSKIGKEFKLTTNGGTVMSHVIDPNTPVGKLAISMKQEQLTNRMTKLVESGRVSTEYLKDTLQPMLVGCVMSFEVSDEGKLGPTSLDPVIDALERLPANASLTGNPKPDTAPAGAFSIEEPHGHVTGKIDADDADKIMGRVFKNLGAVLAK